MRPSNILNALLFCGLLTFAGSACDGDAGTVGGHDTGADVAGGGDAPVPLRCDGVDCFAHAACDEASGACVCDEGFEGFTEGVGCTPEPLALAGSYTDGWGGTHEVTASLWTQGGWGNPSFFHITSFANAERYLLAHNHVHNPWSAGLWSRFDWTFFDDGTGQRLYFCQTSFDAATEAAARAVPPADPTLPTAAGCAGGAWSALTPSDPHLILMGAWVDTYGMNHTITADTWTQVIEGFPEHTYAFALGQFSHAEQWLTAQNDPANPTDGGAWSRFDWTFFDAGEGLELWYCQTVYDAATEDDALAAARADATDPATGGCGASAWSKLVPHVEP